MQIRKNTVTTFIEQLLILTVGYQESLLGIDKLFTELELEAYLTYLNQEKCPIIISIDELILRLQTITASVPHIAEISSNIIHNLENYRQIVVKYLNAFQNLNIHRAALNKSKANLTSEMSHLDNNIYNATKILNKKIVTTIFISATLGLLLTIIIITSLYFIIMNLFKSMDKEITHRINAEQALEKLNFELEKRVEKRTSELLETNVILEHNMLELNKTEEEREKLINELQKALENIKTLSGLIPICSSCKKIRDDQGYWNILESYIQKHSNAQFSHSICPECSDKLYGNEDWYIEMKKK